MKKMLTDCYYLTCSNFDPVLCFKLLFIMKNLYIYKNKTILIII